MITGWIPCSERLPEEDGNYLIWFRYENAIGILSESMAMEYYADSTGWDCDNVEVIAWHPLPKPYKCAKMEEERKLGKWTDQTVTSIEDSVPIKEWQSCRCSECGRYDTRPYMYFFNSPRFCSWCGKQMEAVK